MIILIAVISILSVIISCLTYWKLNDIGKAQKEHGAIFSKHVDAYHIEEKRLTETINALAHTNNRVNKIENNLALCEGSPYKMTIHKRIENLEEGLKTHGHETFKVKIKEKK